MSERRCHTDGLLCDWSPWRGHPHIRDVLTRRCGRCHAFDIRCLPPDVEVGVSDTPTLSNHDRREER